MHLNGSSQTKQALYMSVKCLNWDGDPKQGLRLKTSKRKHKLNQARLPATWFCHQVSLVWPSNFTNRANFRSL